MIKIFTSQLFWFLLCHFILLGVFLCINVKTLWAPFKKIKITSWILLFLIFCLGFYLRNSEYWLGTYTDGYVSQESAHYWLKDGLYVKGCGLGNLDHCLYYQQVLQSAGFPFLIVLYSLLFGFHSLNASIISAVLSSLTIILTFLIAYLLFKKESIALTSSLLLSLIPINILESQSGASRPSGLFFISLAVLVYLIAVDNKFKLKLWSLVVLCTSFSIYVRQENYVLAFFFIVFLPFMKTEALRAWVTLCRQSALRHPDDFSVFCCIEKKPAIKTSGIFIFFIILQIPLLNWLIFDNPFNTYNVPGIFCIYYKNMFLKAPVMLRHLFDLKVFDVFTGHYSFFVSALFLMGSLALLLKCSARSAFPVFLFLTYFLFYSSWSHINLSVAGRLPTYDFARTTLLYNLPYSIIAAYPLGFIKKGRWIYYLIIFSVIIITSPIPLRTLVSKHPLFKDARVKKIFNLQWECLDSEFFQAVAKTPNNSLIITSKHMIATNDYFKNNSRKIVDINLIHPERHDLFLTFIRQNLSLNTPVLYFEDMFCRGSKEYPCEFINRYFRKKLLFTERADKNSAYFIDVYELEWLQK